MEHRSALLAALAGVVALIVVACGGGQTTPTPQPIPTPAEKPPAPAATTPAPTATPSLGPTSPPTTASRPSPTSPAPVPTGPAPRYGGVLQVRFFNYPASFDTYEACCGYVHGIFQNVLNHLVRYERDSLSRIEGDLATGWELGADGKTYTFRLRRDVQWQDGKPFTSADILYNFQRATDPRYPFNKERVAPIANMEAPDPFTFKTTVKRTTASYLPNIASAFFLMYPAHIADPAAWQSAPVGTGAHRVSGATKDVSIELTRNPNYFRKDAAGRQLPYLHGIKYTAIADRGLALAAFRAGRVHCGCTFDQDFMTDAEEQLRREIPGVKLGRFLAGAPFLQFNLRRAPFDNLAFRQAVAISLDKEQLGNVVYRDKKVFPIPPFLLPTKYGGAWALPEEELVKMPGFNPDHSKDLAIAREKFKESGIDPGSVSLTILSSAAVAPDADALASLMITDLGISAKTEITPSAEATSKLKQGNFQISLGLRGVTADDPADAFTVFLSRGGAFNFGGYDNPRIGDLLSAQEAELDEGKRRTLIWEAQRIVLADWPIVPLVGRLSVRGTRPEVFGYSTGPVSHSNVRLDGVWLET